ncbi:hypothetical protein [Roseateles sp.]|uniref:hypothetical protein n=1 Tax=Roseateles sp. TaxID=1971397 RepID=UPI00392B8F28
MSARKSEMRRKALLLKLPKDFQEFKSWPREARSAIPEDELDRYDGLCKAADLFTKKQCVADLAKAAGMRPFRVLDYIETAIEPWKEGNGITGTRAFVRFKVQSNRVRTADLQPSDPQDAPTAGFSGLFGKLFTDHPGIETKLVEFLNGKQRPNKIGDKTLHTKFQAICKEEGLTDEDYPLRCATKGFRPLLRWFKTKYIPQYLLAHIKKNSGKAAGVTAASLSGDGEARTPFCDYLVWVIDECDSNLEAKVIIPSVRWGGDIVRVRRFPVLRLRSLGDYAMNIAFQVCFTRQAKGADVIKLLKNAVLGQPVPPMVDPNMKPVEGAGFPQDIFEKLKFVVPVVIYLDNALAHLFNDLQEVVMRLFGGRVVLGPPGTPLGRPEVESNIHRTRKCFDLQLPGALGSGPKDPLRQIADCPTEKLVHFNHYEQGLYCQLANENVSDSASAGYLDSFTRMKELLARGTFEPNYLPEHLREGYHFCAPKRLPVKCEITTSGRLPFILISPVDRRYSSKWLKANPPDGVREYWILQDYDDLRTAIICNDDMAYVDTLRCEGDWGRVPFDHRIQQIISRRKHAARFKTQAKEISVYQMLQFLADDAKTDWSIGQDFCYFMSYLKRMVTPEELAAAQIEYGSEEAPLVYNDGYVPPTPVRAPATSDPSTGPAMPAPARAHVAPRLPGRRFNVPRGMR